MVAAIAVRSRVGPLVRRNELTPVRILHPGLDDVRGDPDQCSSAALPANVIFAAEDADGAGDVCPVRRKIRRVLMQT